MIERDRLIGWLCMVRYSTSSGCPVMVPDLIQHALKAQGWLDVETEENSEGTHDIELSAAGLAVSDLNYAEWGIDPIGVDA